MGNEQQFKESETIWIPASENDLSLKNISPPIIRQDGNKIILEAEDACIKGASIVGHYVDFPSNFDGSIEWPFQINTSGLYLFSIKYSCGQTLGEPSRSLKTSLDGHVHFEKLDFPRTLTWNDWNDTVFTLTLQPGLHSFKIETCGFNGPNIDSLTIHYADPSPKSNSTKTTN